MTIRFGRQTKIKFVGGELHIKVQGQDVVTEQLTGVIRRSQDLSVPFTAFRPVWFDSIQDAFDSGGDPVPWPDLSPAYAGWKQGVAPGQPIMRLTDRLYDSVTNMTSDTIWFAGPRSMQLGTRVPYFIFHQEGRGVPARPVITLPTRAAATLVTMVTNYVGSGRISR